MLDNVPENDRGLRDDDYNFCLPQNIYAYLSNYPQYKLIYNWDNLHALLKSDSKPRKFRSQLKFNFLEKYKN